MCQVECIHVQGRVHPGSGYPLPSLHMEGQSVSMTQILYESWPQRPGVPLLDWCGERKRVGREQKDRNGVSAIVQCKVSTVQ